MGIDHVKEQSKFLLAEYKACLNNGLIESPEQFLMRMSVDTKVEAYVLPNLKQMKNFFDKKLENRKNDGKLGV